MQRVSRRSRKRETRDTAQPATLSTVRQVLVQRKSQLTLNPISKSLQYPCGFSRSHERPRGTASRSSQQLGPGQPAVLLRYEPTPHPPPGRMCNSSSFSPYLYTLSLRARAADCPFSVLPSLPLLVSFIGPYLFTYRGHALQRLDRSLTHEHPPTHTSLASPLPLIPVRAHRHDPGRLPRRPPLRRQVWQRPEVPVQCRRVQEL